jgi:hypothetical protein
VKLFNAIAIYDIYIVAESGEAARKALVLAIKDDPDFKPSEVVANESVREGSIREGWREERPLVAADVSDGDFEKVRGRTTSEIFQRLYLKR